jgi:formamidopyrimidine-DNA glycosylase
LPELPEVETVRAGAAAHLVGRRLVAIEFLRHELRWPIPIDALQGLQGRRCTAVDRRAKYLLLRFAGHGQPVALVHLGMSGRCFVERLRAGGAPPPLRRHEHWRMHFEGRLVRYVDPRRFGALGIARGCELAAHPWLAGLGQEPLASGFDGAFLHRRTRGRRCSSKALLMDASIVVGIGNIYASEACWLAGVRPRRAAGSLSRRECDALADAVGAVLRAAIAAGGTTFRDFRGAGEEAGWFARELAVYERAGQGCRRCGAMVRRTVDHGRSTYWCAGCQR